MDHVRCNPRYPRPTARYCKHLAYHAYNKNDCTDTIAINPKLRWVSAVKPCHVTHIMAHPVTRFTHDPLTPCWLCSVGLPRVYSFPSPSTSEVQDFTVKGWMMGRGEERVSTYILRMGSGSITPRRFSKYNVEVWIFRPAEYNPFSSSVIVC